MKTGENIKSPSPPSHVEPRNSRASPKSHALPALARGPDPHQRAATAIRLGHRSQGPLEEPSDGSQHLTARCHGGNEGHRGPWARVDAVAEADARIAAQDAGPLLFQGEPTGGLHGHQAGDIAAGAAGEEAQRLSRPFGSALYRALDSERVRSSGSTFCSKVKARSMVALRSCCSARDRGTRQGGPWRSARTRMGLERIEKASQEPRRGGLAGAGGGGATLAGGSMAHGEGPLRGLERGPELHVRSSSGVIYTIRKRMALAKSLAQCRQRTES